MKAANRIESHMTEYPSIASRSATVTEAAEFMRNHGIRHLPVLEGKNVVGVISDRDLRQAELLSDSMGLIVADVMTPDPYCAKVGTPLSEIAAEMATHKYGCVVVLGEDGRVVGIFTTTDGMRVLSELLESKTPPDFKFFGIGKLLKNNYLVGV